LSGGMSRYLHDVIDPRFLQLTGDGWPLALFAAFLVFVALKVRLRAIPMLLMILAVGAVSAVLLGYSNRVDPLTGFALLVDPGMGLGRLASTLIDYFVIVTVWSRRPIRSTVVFLLVLVVLSDLPEIAVLQPNMHMVYFTHGLQSLLVATMSVTFLRIVAGRVRARRETSIPEYAGSGI